MLGLRPGSAIHLNPCYDCLSRRQACRERSNAVPSQSICTLLKRRAPRVIVVQAATEADDVQVHHLLLVLSQQQTYFSHA